MADELERGAETTSPPQKTAEIEAILRALPDLFFLFDAQGRFLDFSAPASSMLYAPPRIFLGKYPHEVMPPELADKMERARAATHASGALVAFEYDIELAGRCHHCEARYVPHIEGQTIALVRDVSDRVQAEHALRVSEARLRESQKLDVVGRLAGGVAHDFNNLLMIILGYTAAVSRHISDKHPAAGAMKEIVRAVDRATALTKQMLALSRRQPRQPVAVDVGSILNDMGRMLAGVIGENVELEMDVSPGLSSVLADHSQIEQVVLNLVLNARDAMPRGGRLSIRAHNVGAHPAAVALTVSDSGEGMDADTQARIFEPFFTTKARGSGLGLYVVQEIVRAHGGELAVRSQRSGGTEIELRLPAIEQAPESLVASDRGEPLSGGFETVLLVEDEEPLRALLTEVLEQLGYHILAAENAEQALTLLAGVAEVDLLLTDVVMPGKSGWELAEHVVGLHPECCVLYMSGHPIEVENDARSPAVRGDMLQKPFSPSMLARVIREQLDRRSTVGG
jgi:signal transduction histidine kinase